MRFLLFISCLFFVTSATVSSASFAAEPPPNIVLLIADDMTWRDCGAYGNDEVHTPHIDRLASEGMAFDNMFTSTAMCAPTRQQLYTGMWPVRNGAYPNHSRVRDGVKSIVHHLQALGYRVGLSGKKHFKPAQSFPFERVGTGAAIKQFMVSKPAQPYCLIVASNHPHRPWSEGDSGRYDAARLTIPPYLVDTPQTRAELVDYYAEVTALDAQLGTISKLIDETKQRDRTMLIFTSEQGSGFPFGGKWTCYENGLKTAFIARWPGVIPANSRTAAMTQYVDVVPTLVELAGGQSSKLDAGIPGAPDGGRGLDGVSFAAALRGESYEGREYVYGVHTTNGIIKGSESYPIRSVRDARYKYIWNPSHEESFQGLMTTDGGVYSSWQAAARDQPKLLPRVQLVTDRPEVELYDLREDPFELNNLADEPRLKDVKRRLRKELNRWLASQDDEPLRSEAAAKPRRGKRK